MKLPELSLPVRLFVTATAIFSLQTVLLQGTAWSQSISTAQVSGEIKDPTGASIPGAQVTVTDQSKGFSRSAVSDSTGTYQLLQLPPGSYTVGVKATGFSEAVENNVILTVGEQANLPFFSSSAESTRKCWSMPMRRSSRPNVRRNRLPSISYASQTCRPMVVTTSTSP